MIARAITDPLLLATGQVASGTSLRKSSTGESPTRSSASITRLRRSSPLTSCRGCAAGRPPPARWSSPGLSAAFGSWKIICTSVRDARGARHATLGTGDVHVLEVTIAPAVAGTRPSRERPSVDLPLPDSRRRGRATSPAPHRQVDVRRPPSRCRPCGRTGAPKALPCRSKCTDRSWMSTTCGRRGPRSTSTQASSATADLLSARSARCRPRGCSSVRPGRSQHSTRGAVAADWVSTGSLVARTPSWRRGNAGGTGIRTAGRPGRAALRG